VLRRRDSGESDRRLTILTREKGKIDVIAKGARKAGSRLAGSSDPLTVAQLGLATGKVNMFITQTQPLASFRGLRTDYDRLSYALALLELYAAVVPQEQPDSDIFDLLLISLQNLEVHPKPQVALVWCELQLMSYAGFLPIFDMSAVSGEPLLRPNTQDPTPNTFVSPAAGGYVTQDEAGHFPDRFRVRAEALLGLARTAELPEPSPNLKFADEALIALFPFWRHIAETQLPANESAVNELRLARHQAENGG
jgi:DNA repair protein RecO (recombination protein O)